jgi:hypothetical protein
MRPSPLRCLVACLSVTLAMTTQSIMHAQEPTSTQPPGGMGPPGRQSLVLQEAVQSDLGLSDKQKNQLNNLQASIGQKSRDLFQSAQENGADPQEFREAMAGLYREHQSSLLRVLDKTQKSRLAQIELQREGFLAASRSEFASKLKVTSPQTKKIKTIVGEMRREQAKAMPGALQQEAAPPAKSAGTAKTKKGTSKTRRPSGGTAGQENEEMGGDPEFAGNGFFGGGVPGGGGGLPGGQPDVLTPEAQADLARFQEVQAKSREEAKTKIGEVLTPEQKAGFEKLTGKPFDFSKIQDGPPTAKLGEEAEPKADEAAKKAAMSKGQPKSKAKKTDQ